MTMEIVAVVECRPRAIVAGVVGYDRVYDR